MKKGIHPKYYQDCQATCACGNTFTTGSTMPEIRVDICSACHPFYTGQAKYIDSEGRIERFERKRKMAASRLKSPKVGKKIKVKAKSKKKTVKKK